MTCPFSTTSPSPTLRSPRTPPLTDIASKILPSLLISSPVAGTRLVSSPTMLQTPSDENITRKAMPISQSIGRRIGTVRSSCSGDVR